MMTPANDGELLSAGGGQGRLSTESQLAVISRDMERFEESLNGLGAKMDKIHSSLDEDIGKASTIAANNAVFQNRIEGSLRTLQIVGALIQLIIVAWVAWVTTGHASDADRLTRVEDQLKSLEGSIQQINSRFESVPSDVKVLVTEIANLQGVSAKLDSTAEKANKATEDIAKISTAIAGIQSDIENIQLQGSKQRSKQ
jgi:DNA repair ATPase RecN